MKSVKNKCKVFCFLCKENKICKYDNIRNKKYQQGFEEGYLVGYKNGCEEGIECANREYNRGYKDGLEKAKRIALKL